MYRQRLANVVTQSKLHTRQLSKVLLEFLLDIFRSQDTNRETAQRMCTSCRALFTDVLSLNLYNSRWTIADRRFFRPTLWTTTHPGPTTNSTCEVCGFFAESLPILQQTPQEMKISFRPPDSASTSTWRDLGATSFWIRIETQEPMCLSEHRKNIQLASLNGVAQEWLKLDPLRMIDLNGQVHADMLAHLYQYVSKRSNGRGAIQTMATWSAECARNHTRCQRSRTRPLPRRVIEVGKTSDPYVRLAESLGKHGIYATLSHRWGPITTQFTTTSSNYTSHLQRIAIEVLPATFRDAIAVCRELHIPYIWIDSLCIIQGNDSDWHSQSHEMSDVFEHSFLTISALNAKDSNSGLFSLRASPLARPVSKTTPILRLKHEVQVVCQWPPEEGETLKQALENSAMRSRGWILQERLLSPAVLHFGTKQLHWECREKTLTERIPKYDLFGGITNGVLEYRNSGDPFLRWYRLIEQYSSMSLSLESDRLPAIQGLITRFKNTFRCSSLAGLWLEDIHRGLLWHPSRQSRPSDLPKAVVPSWSWVSCSGPILTDMPRRLGENAPQHYYEKDDGWDKSLTLSKRIPDFDDMEMLRTKIKRRRALGRSAINGEILMHACVVKVTASSSRISRLCILRRKHHVEEVICYLDEAPPTDVFHCYCLIVGTWSCDQMSMWEPHVETRNELWRCFLVLKRIQKPRRNAHKDHMGVFDRIGMGGAKVEEMKAFLGNNVPRRYLTLV